MTTVYWFEESPGKFTAFHELRERETIEDIDGIGKVLVMKNQLGWPMGAVKIVGISEYEPPIQAIT